MLDGHTPTPEPEWVNNTICLDIGGVFGGKLTALRYPEKDVVAVPAEKVWYKPTKPFPASADDRATTARAAEELSITDVLGKRGVETRLTGRVTVREENAAGGLEVMNRFALVIGQESVHAGHGASGTSRVPFADRLRVLSSRLVRIASRAHRIGRPTQVYPRWRAPHEPRIGLVLWQGTSGRDVPHA